MSVARTASWTAGARTEPQVVERETPDGHGEDEGEQEADGDGRVAAERRPEGGIRRIGRHAPKVDRREDGGVEE